MSSEERQERPERTERSHFDPKKNPNYRLVGRNIFDPSIQQKFMKVRNKMHPYNPYNPYFKPHNPHYFPHPPPPYMYKRPLPPGFQDEKAFKEAQKQHYLNNNNNNNKKQPNYRLVGRNIFDPTLNQPAFMKPTAKTNKYYDRFIKQHPLSHLPLAFQKSVSLAEDKALEEKEKLKHKKKRKKKSHDNSQESSGSDSNSDSDDDSQGEKRDGKTGKYYSDISSDSDLDSSKKKSKKKKDKKKKKKNKNKNSDHSSNSSSDSSDSEDRSQLYKHDYGEMSGADSDGSMINLRENLKPIGAYIKNRDQMFEEMVRSIRGAKLQAMLPDALKNVRFDFIRKKCLEELEIMSKKRIKYTLNGETMTSSSGTEESSDELIDEGIQALDDSKKSVLDDKTKKANTNQPQNAKPAFVPKFKPIGDTNENSNDTETRQLNEQADGENENSVESPQNENTIPSTDQQNATQQQSGIAAAGFKKFVKKSISIKLKAADGTAVKSSSNNSMYQNQRDSQPNRSDELITYKHFQMNNDFVDDEIHADMLDLNGMDPNRNYKHSYNKHMRPNEALYDYNYDLDDELFNLNTEIEKNATHESDLLNSRGDSDTSYCSSCNGYEYSKKHKKRSKLKAQKSNELWNYLSDSSLSLSNQSDLSDVELVNKKSKSKSQLKSKRKKDALTVSSKKSGKSSKSSSKTSKKQVAKKVSVDEVTSDRSDNDESISVDVAREILKNKLETYIENMTDSDADNELKDILENLLNQINENEDLTLEECAEIDQTFNYLYDQVNGTSNEETQKVSKSKTKKTSDDSDSESDIVNSKETSKKRKRKGGKSSKTSDSHDKSLKRKRKSSETLVKHKRKNRFNTADESDLDNKSNDIEEIDELEAGEIDDIYDDEFVLEKELQNLLQ